MVRHSKSHNLGGNTELPISAFCNAIFPGWIFSSLAFQFYFFIVKYYDNYQWLQLLLVLNTLAVWINKFCLHLAKISKDLHFLCTISFLNYRKQTPGMWSLLQLPFLNSCTRGRTLQIHCWCHGYCICFIAPGGIALTVHVSRLSHSALNQGERCKCKIFS